MLYRVLVEDYALANRVSGSKGSATLTGDTGANFTKCACVGMGVFVDISGVVKFMGKIASVTGDTVFVLDRILKYDLTTARWYGDWTRWVLSIGEITKKIESENAFETGMIVYDDVSISVIAKLPDGSASAPAMLFDEDDIDSRTRLVVRIFGVSLDYADELLSTEDLKDLLARTRGIATLFVDEELSAHTKVEVMSQVFEGVVDLLTLSENVVNDVDEIVLTYSFTVKDKLSALNMLVSSLMRESTTLYGIYYWPLALLPIEKFGVSKAANTNEFSMNDCAGFIDGDAGAIASTVPGMGEILRFNLGGGSTGWVLCTFKAEGPYTGYLDRVYYDSVCDGGVFYALGTTRTGIMGGELVTGANITKLSALYGSIDVYKYGTATKTFHDGTGAAHTLTSREITGVDAVKLLNVFLKNVWADCEIVNDLRDSVGTLLTEYILPPQYIFQLLDKAFNEEPYDAVKRIIASLNAYIFTDSIGRFVITNRINPSASSMTKKEIDLARVIAMEKKLFYDKLTDSVVVNVKGFAGIPGTADYYSGTGYAFKVVGVKARNELSVDVVVDLLSLDTYGMSINSQGAIVYGSPPWTDQSEILDKYCDLKAEELFGVYGLRRIVRNVEVSGMTMAEMAWQLMNIVSYGGADYYLKEIKINLYSGQMNFQLVSCQGWEYNIAAIVIGKKRDEYLTGG